MLYYCRATTASPNASSLQALSLTDDERLIGEVILEELKFPCN